MNEFKQLWAGEVQKEYLEDKTTVAKNDKNEDITTTVKEKVLKPVKVIVANPNRVQREEAELFNSIESSKLISRGILTRSALSNKLFGDLIKQAEEIQLQYAEIAPKDKEKVDKDTQAKIDTLNAEYGAILKKILAEEQNHSNLLAKTVESIVDGKMYEYWALNLSYIQEEGKKPEPLFPGKTLEDKYKVLDKNEEERSQFYLDAAQKVSSVVALWRVGINSQEEIDKRLVEINKDEKEVEE